MKKWKCKLLGHKWKEMRIEDKEGTYEVRMDGVIGEFIGTCIGTPESKPLKCSKCSRTLEKCKRCGAIKCDCGVG